MSTKARIALTVALGVVMGLTWLGADWANTAFIVAIVLVPLIVGRWWVVAALAGPLIVWVVGELTGHVSEGASDGIGPVFLWAIFALNIYGLFMLTLVGIRKAFDFLRSRLLRNRRATTNA